MDSVTMAFDDPADLDGDGTVGVGDFLLMLAAWGECPGGEPCPGDLDSDGTVDVADGTLGALSGAEHEPNPTKGWQAEPRKGPEVGSVAASLRPPIGKLGTMSWSAPVR
jgi:hypothetical protein